MNQSPIDYREVLKDLEHRRDNYDAAIMAIENLGKLDWSVFQDLESKDSPKGVERC